MTPRFEKKNSTTFRVNHSPHAETIVGGDGEENFEPEALLKKWDGECSLNIGWNKFGSFQKWEKITNDKNNIEKVKWVEDAFEAHFYPINKESSEQGAFEFEIILKQNPPTNTFSLPIETNNLDFFYQPELTEKEKKNGARRPEDVVGSYAVYHSNKSNIHPSESEAEKYKTGKAFHIYRPLLIDNSGDETFADLEIDEDSGTLTITVKQSWLDNAEYPVRIDPTFGYEESGSSDDYLCIDSGGTDYFYTTGSYFSISESFTPTSISYYISNVTGNADTKTALADHTDDSLLETSSSSLTDSTGWETRSISGASEYTSGDYWILSLGDANDISTDSVGPKIAFDAGSTDQGSRADTGSYSFDNPITTSLNNKKYSIYCTCTVEVTDSASLFSTTTSFLQASETGILNENGNLFPTTASFLTASETGILTDSASLFSISANFLTADEFPVNVTMDGELFSINASFLTSEEEGVLNESGDLFSIQANFFTSSDESIANPEANLFSTTANFLTSSESLIITDSANLFSIDSSFLTSSETLIITDSADLFSIETSFLTADEFETFLILGDTTSKKTIILNLSSKNSITQKLNSKEALKILLESEA